MNKRLIIIGKRQTQANNSDGRNLRINATKWAMTLLFAWFCLPVFSETFDGKRNETVVLHFRNVSSALDTYYMDNDRMLAILDRTLEDQSLSDRLDHVSITGAASPDGFTSRNERLANERAMAVKNYIAMKYPHIDRNRIITHSAGEDWNGLRKLIEADYKVPSRQEALRILNLSLSGDEKRKRLRQLNAGRTYDYLLKNIFPNLRGGVACMIYYKKESKTPLVEREIKSSENTTTYTISAQQVNITNYNGSSVTTENSQTQNIANDYLPPVHESRSVQPSHSDDDYPRLERSYRSVQPSVYDRYSQIRKPKQENRYVNYATYHRYDTYEDELPYEKTLFSLKTNLLFDAFTAVNIELEIPLDKSWSLAAEYMFPWWLDEDKQNAFQLIGGSLELRRWFGNRDNRAPLTGWFGGFSLGGGYYDLEDNKKGYQGEYFVPRLSLGYAHEISRNGRWRMEYAFGLGYLRSKYREYEARLGKLDNEWHLIYQRSGTYKYVGPVSAKISLAYTFKK